MSRDKYNIGMRFAHACGDCSDANFCNELDVYPRIVVGVFQIMNELRKILN